MECVDLATFTFATFISLGASLISFPSIFRSLSQKKWIVELFHWIEFRDWKENEIFSSQTKNASKHARITSGSNHHTKDSRESWRCSFHFRCVTNKIVFTTPEAPVIRCFLLLKFCVDFLRIYAIEVNSLAVWSKRVKRFKGNLIICWGKQELARTCSVYINAQDKRSKFTVVASACVTGVTATYLYFVCPLGTNKLNFDFYNVRKKAVYC